MEKQIEALFRNLELSLEKLAPRFNSRFGHLDIKVTQDRVPTDITVRIVDDTTSKEGSAIISFVEAAGLDYDIIAAFLLGMGKHSCNN